MGRGPEPQLPGGPAAALTQQQQQETTRPGGRDGGSTVPATHSDGKACYPGKGAVSGAGSALRCRGNRARSCRTAWDARRQRAAGCGGVTGPVTRPGAEWCAPVREGAGLLVRVGKGTHAPSPREPSTPKAGTRHQSAGARVSDPASQGARRLCPSSTGGWVLPEVRQRAGRVAGWALRGAAGFGDAFCFRGDRLPGPGCVSAAGLAGPRGRRDED